MGVNLPLQNITTKRINPTTWVRPADWPTIVDAANEVQFLFSDINDASCTVRTQFTRSTGAQNVVIDWGDGSTSTVSTTSTTDTTHTYIPGTGTPCSRGYTTFVVRVYFTGAGTSILNETRIFPILPGTPTLTSTNKYQTCALLEAYYGDGTFTVSAANYFGGGNAGGTGIALYNYLEFIKLPSTVTWTATNLMFYRCSSLYKIIMPTSAVSLTNIASMFFGCTLLQSVILPSNSTGITTATSTFGQCSSLSSITFPPTLNSCANLSSTFTSCNSLKLITIPSINAATDLSGMFTSCFALESVKFTSMPTPGVLTAVNCNSMFSGCNNLQNVIFPNTCNGNANYNMSNGFLNCERLVAITFPSNFNPNTITNLFNGCIILNKVVFQSGMSRCTDMGALFNNCKNLKTITMPSSVAAAGVSMVNTFNGCVSLDTITIPSGYLFTSLSNTFYGCYGLKTLNWTPGIQNSLTTMVNAFANCILLTTVTLPTSLNVVTSLGSCFTGCYSLQSHTAWPATMNAVTTVSGLYSNCYSLTSVTLPTSMTACTLFNSMFSGCYNITTITLPTTVSNSTTTFASAFAGCASLKTVTFPNHQLSSVTDISTMFQYCSNLTTITNFNRLGSLTATPLVTAALNNNARLISVSFSCPTSIIQMNGSSANEMADVRSIRLTNLATGQWGGASPQIAIQYTNMNTAAIVQLFTDMNAQPNVVGKTINITGAVGAAGLTPVNRALVTSKGWTITG